MALRHSKETKFVSEKAQVNKTRLVRKKTNKQESLANPKSDCS